MLAHLCLWGTPKATLYRESTGNQLWSFCVRPNLRWELISSGSKRRCGATMKNHHSFRHLHLWTALKVTLYRERTGIRRGILSLGRRTLAEIDVRTQPFRRYLYRLMACQSGGFEVVCRTFTGTESQRLGVAYLTCYKMCGMRLIVWVFFQL